MSVEYSSTFAYGWVISREERDKIDEETNHEFEDEFVCLNGWVWETDYFFGIQLEGIESGYAYPISAKSINCEEVNAFLRKKYPPEVLARITCEGKPVFEYDTAQHWILSCVW